MKIKDLPKTEKIKKRCSICGKDIAVILRPDRTYHGGNYFGKLPGKREYWECDKCYNEE